MLPRLVEVVCQIYLNFRDSDDAGCVGFISPDQEVLYFCLIMATAQNGAKSDFLAPKSHPTRQMVDLLHVDTKIVSWPTG